MDMHSRMSSLPTRSNAPHSSRRLSSNSSLSSLSELGMLEQQQRPHERPSSSSSVKTVSSSPSSTNGNMMKKLGSRFMLKRKDTAAAAAASHDNAIEELLDNDDDEEDSQILATARPRAGRILTSSNASTAGRTSIYGDLNNSGNANRLKHRSSLSNLNASNGSIASISSNSGNASMQRQPNTLRHRASISSLSGSDNGAKSQPGTALRQPGTLRHRNSVSSLSGSTTRDANPTSPPGTSSRQPNTLRHRSSITSLSSVAMSKPSTIRETPSIQGPSRIRTMSTTTASSTTRPSNFPSSITANESGNISTINGIGSLSNARRLSASHTGLASLRTRTTSLISPPKANTTGLSSGISARQSSSHGNGSSSSSSMMLGDTSIARRGIPKSSTTSIARIASTSSNSGASNTSSSSSSMSHKRIHSVTDTSLQFDSTPKATTLSSRGGGMKKITSNRNNNIEDSPGLEDLVNNTTLQMADLKDMLSPIAISRVTANRNNSNTNYIKVGSASSSGKTNYRESTKSNNTSSATILDRKNMKDIVDLEGAEEGLENTSNSPSKSSLPILHRTDSTRKAVPKSSSPSPTKIRIKSASPKKNSAIVSSSAIGTSGMRTALTQDGLPVMPGSRKGTSPSMAQLRPPPSTNTSSKISRHLSPSPALSISSSTSTSRSTTPLIKRTIKESKDFDVLEMEKLLLSDEEGFLQSPDNNLITADMQDDLLNVMMTPLKVNQEQSNGDVLSMEHNMKEEERKLEIERLLKAEREKIIQEIESSMKEERKIYETKAIEEFKKLESKLSKKEEDYTKQSRELIKLQKLLACNSKDTLRTIQFENQSVKQDTCDITIRRLKRDLEDSRNIFKKREMNEILDMTRNYWKNYGKEIEIEKDIVSGQLETMEQLKGLVGHISLCVQRNMMVATQ